MQSVKNSVNSETQTSPLASPHMNRRPHHHHHHRHHGHGHSQTSHGDREKPEKASKDRVPDRDLISDGRNPIADWERDRGMDRDRERERRVEKERRAERERREKVQEWDHRNEKERRSDRERPLEKNERENRERDRAPASAAGTSHQAWPSRTTQSQVCCYLLVPYC